MLFCALLLFDCDQKKIVTPHAKGKCVQVRVFTSHLHLSPVHTYSLVLLLLTAEKSTHTHTHIYIYILTYILTYVYTHTYMDLYTKREQIRFFGIS